MSGIEVPAAAIGIAGFCFTVLFGCLKGFILLQSARCIGQDLSAIRLMLQCEMHELESWAQEVGLLDQPPTLRVEVGDVNYIQPILEHIQTFVTDLRKLRSEFHLDLRKTDEELHPATENADDAPAQRIWGRIRKSDQLAMVSKNSRQAWRRICWVSGDATQVEKLLGRIGFFVRQLRTYLDRTQKAAMDNKIEIMYRTPIGTTLSHDFLSWKGKHGSPVISDAAVSAAARVRNMGLALDLLPVDQTPSTSPKTSFTAISDPATSLTPSIRTGQGQLLLRNIGGTSMRLSKTRLRVEEPFTFDQARQLGFLDNSLILLEWRMIDRSLYKSTEPRINKTSRFLRELADSSFQSLQCIGYVDDQDMHRYGYVFEIPTTATQILKHNEVTKHGQSSRLPLAIVSLKDLFDKKLCPSLNIRVQLAITMMSTILQLHTSGWLHKALHWDNVLSFTPPDPDITTVTTSRLTCHPAVYLTGYSHARADSHLETTEPSLAQLYAELYRHPSSLGPTRLRYRKSFDLFSVGCMLLELGLWSHLQDILNDALTPKDGRKVDPHTAAHRLLTAKAQFIESLPSLDLKAEESSLVSHMLQRLAASTGDAYVCLVVMCLTASDYADSPRDETDRMLRLENDVVLGLRRLAEYL